MYIHINLCTALNFFIFPAKMATEKKIDFFRWGGVEVLNIFICPAKIEPESPNVYYL